MQSLFIASWFVGLAQSRSSWIALAIVALIGALFALKINRDFRREDEAKEKKYRRENRKRVPL
jgi:hypothetical protein